MTYQRKSTRRAVGVLLGALLALSLVAGVSAHETREVEEFEFTVGFMNEPAYVNEINGIDLRISRPDAGNQDDEDADDEENGHGGGEPVENAHETLRAAILFGEETMEVELRPVWGEPGAYTADVVPTATGTYSFQFIGEIDGMEINETFRAGPDAFAEVEDSEALQFPSDPPSPADESDQAAAFGIAGVAAGLLGLLAGGAAYYKVSKSTPDQPGPAQRRRQQQRPSE